MKFLTKTITTAQTNALSSVFHFPNGAPRSLTVHSNFVYGSGGTSFDAYLQTSLDGGSTWIDILNFHATTANLRSAANLSANTPVTTPYAPTDASLAANTTKDGILGSMYRVKYTSVGTYAGSSSINIDVESDTIPKVIN